MVDPKTLDTDSLVDCNVTLRSGRVVQSRGVVQAVGATFAHVLFCSPDTDGAKLQGKVRKLPFDCMTLADLVQVSVHRGIS
jgi:hypothetical protein